MSRNTSPRCSKLLNWSQDAQAGDSSTTPPPLRIGQRHVPRPMNRGVERAAHLIGHRARQGVGEALRRLADQEGAGDAREQRTQALDAAFLGLAAGDPIDAVVADHRFFGGIGIGGLAVIDVADAVDDGDHLLAMAQAGIGGQALGDRLGRHAAGARHRIGRAGILPIVAARQAGDRLEIDDLFSIVDQHAVRGVDAALHHPLDGDRVHDDVLAVRQPEVDLGAMLVVHGDDGGAAGRQAVEHRGLGGDIAFHAAMAGR